MEHSFPPKIAAMLERLIARGVILPEARDESDAALAARRALLRARVRLARARTEEVRAAYRVYVKHLECELERAEAGGYDR